MDAILMGELIEHVPNPVEFLRRAEMVVKPGGLVYITTPNYNSHDRRLLGYDWKAIHREHLSYFTHSTLRNLVKRNTSLEILHVETRNVSEQLIANLQIIFKNLANVENIINVSGCDTIARQPLLRMKIAKSRWLLFLKKAANSILNVTSLGSTIVMLLRCPLKK